VSDGSKTDCSTSKLTAACDDVEKRSTDRLLIWSKPDVNI